MAGILVYGGSDKHNSGAINAINSLKTMFNYLGGAINDVVHGTAMNVGDIEQNEKIMDKIKKLGIKIMNKL